MQIGTNWRHFEADRRITVVGEASGARTFSNKVNVCLNLNKRVKSNPRRLETVNGYYYFVAVLVSAFSFFGGWLSILLLTQARVCDSHSQCLSPQICSFSPQNVNCIDSCCWFPCNEYFRGRFHCKRGPCTFLDASCVYMHMSVCVLALLA